tara:strand:+ start:174 stop:404 length:231 start_codon:yes stop_codon:yes gene_type:complete
MKVGDLVVHKQSSARDAGLVVDIIQKKVWRTNVQGKKVDWNKVDPEPHAVVLWSHNSDTLAVPLTELSKFKDKDDA